MRTLNATTMLTNTDGEIIAHTIGDTQDLEFVFCTLNQLLELNESCILH